MDEGMPVLTTILVYARDMQRSAAFYRDHFGFSTSGEVVEGLIELTSFERGMNILVHQAAKSVKLGHAGMKLVFSVPDVWRHSRCTALPPALNLAVRIRRTVMFLRILNTRMEITSVSPAGHTDHEKAARLSGFFVFVDMLSQVTARLAALSARYADSRG